MYRVVDLSYLPDGLSALSNATVALTGWSLRILGAASGGIATSEFVREGLSALSNAAGTLTGWSLAMLGATVAGIVSSEYLRPEGRIRFFYLLFLPGWLSLGASIFYGDRIARRFAAAAFTQNFERLTQIGQAMNCEYAQQRCFFQLAVFVFGLWLISLLLWWVFARKIDPKPHS